MSETAGNRCETLVANRTISPMPITNSGSAASDSVVIERMWSVGLSRLTAIHTPSPIDSGSATSAETSTRNAELRIRAEISEETGCSVAAEVPKLPVITPPSQWKYCDTADSLRCSWRVSAASRAGVALRPRIARAALPGSAWVAANTTIDTSSRISSPRRMRRSRNRLMALGSPDQAARR